MPMHDIDLPADYRITGPARPRCRRTTRCCAATAVTVTSR